jgi:hypothetical protein
MDGRVGDDEANERLGDLSDDSPAVIAESWLERLVAPISRRLARFIGAGGRRTSLRDTDPGSA